MSLHVHFCLDSLAEKRSNYGTTCNSTNSIHLQRLQRYSKNFGRNSIRCWPIHFIVGKSIRKGNFIPTNCIHFIKIQKDNCIAPLRINPFSPILSRCELNNHMSKSLFLIFNHYLNKISKFPKFCKIVVPVHKLRNFPILCVFENKCIKFVGSISHFFLTRKFDRFANSLIKYLVAEMEDQ